MKTYNNSFSIYTTLTHTTNMYVMHVRLKMYLISMHNRLITHNKFVYVLFFLYGSHFYRLSLKSETISGNLKCNWLLHCNYLFISNHDETGSWMVKYIWILCIVCDQNCYVQEKCLLQKRNTYGETICYSVPEILLNFITLFFMCRSDKI